MRYISLILITLFFVAFISCTKDKATPFAPPTPDACAGIDPSYSQDIAPIIETHCTDFQNGDCHQVSSSNGDFTFYGGLKEKIQSGDFEWKVLISRTMPPDTTKGPALSDDNLQILQCWYDDGFPNN